MKITDEMVERAARAMCERDGFKWDAASVMETANGDEPEQQREYWRDKADAALPAALAVQTQGNEVLIAVTRPDEYDDVHPDILGEEAIVDGFEWRVVSPLAGQTQQGVEEDLDERMKAAGMYTIAEMMGVTPLTKWKSNPAINTLDAFSEWVDRKVSEYLTMKAGYDLGDKSTDDELYEWIEAHAAVFGTIRDQFQVVRSALVDVPAVESEPVASLQDRVQPWMMACFGPEISADKLERNDRFMEEALELVQASDYPKDRVLALVDYVYERDQGEINQEVGGVMITLAAHCLAHGVDMHEAGETELARIWTKVGTIRAKQAAKPTGSALPVAHPPRSLSNEGWMPIETAPKDGSEILLAWQAVAVPEKGAEWFQTVGRWDETFEYIGDEAAEYRGSWTDDAVASWAYQETRELNPTHWQPLPTPPSTRKGSSEGDGSATITKDADHG